MHKFKAPTIFESTHKVQNNHMVHDIEIILNLTKHMLRILFGHFHQRRCGLWESEWVFGYFGLHCVNCVQPSSNRTFLNKIFAFIKFLNIFRINIVGIFVLLCLFASFLWIFSKVQQTEKPTECVEIGLNFSHYLP